MQLEVSVTKYSNENQESTKVDDFEPLELDSIKQSDAQFTDSGFVKSAKRSKEPKHVQVSRK